MDRANKHNYKQTELGQIPIEWEIKTLGEIGNFRKGKGIAKKDLTVDGYPCVLYGELYTQYSELISDIISKTNIDPANSVEGYYNDVLIPSSGETAYDIACASSLLVDKVLIGGDTNIFRPKKDINGAYLSYSINSILKDRLSKLAQGSSVYHLYSDPLSKFSVIIPPLKEQQKIAEILSKVDEQIKKTEQLIEKTKELKKGLMQQLFTKGIGHTEFKQTVFGEIPVEWEVQKLSNVSIKITDGSHSSPQEVEFSKYKICTVKHMKYNEFDIKNATAISENDYMKLVNNGCKPEINDVLLSKDGTIGKTFVYRHTEQNIVLLSSIAIIRPNLKLLCPDFLKFYIQNPSTILKITGMKSGSAIKRIVLRDINNLDMILPSIKEQQKITEILLTVDQQIETYEKEKEKQIELKKGLIQQLLTGKVRVTV